MRTLAPFLASIALSPSLLSGVALGQKASPRTELVPLEIVPSGEEAHGGECWAPSKVLRRAGAWRCTDDDELFILDPCVSVPDDDKHVVCLSPTAGSSPSEELRAKHEGTRLELIAPLPTNGWPAYSPVRPFQLLLVNGGRCIFERATVRLPKAELHYACTGSWLILGEPRLGKQWSVTEVRLDQDRQQIVERRDVAVAAVWY